MLHYKFHHALKYFPKNIFIGILDIEFIIFHIPKNEHLLLLMIEFFSGINLDNLLIFSNNFVNEL